MNKILSLALSIILALSAIADSKAQEAMGLLLNDSAYNDAPHLAAGGKAINTTASFSLKALTPYPASQGTCSSCVCWASCYAALTTSWAYKANITNRATITSMAKSPMFVYVQLTNTCTKGTNIDYALNILKTQGTCGLVDFNPRTYDGETSADLTALKQVAYDYRIKDYAAIFPLKADSAKKIDETRLSLVNHQPVIAGFKLYNSFKDLRKGNALWHPDPSETITGYHAMCVIGYNDYDKTFEVMNSWGTNWGDDGYFNISYQDYVRLAVYGYQITMDERPLPNDPVKVSGSFELHKFTEKDKASNQLIFTQVSPKRTGNTYTLDGEDLKTGDYYKLYAKNVSPNCYIYVFSIDPDGKAEVLYPFSKNSAFSKINDVSRTTTEVPRLYKNGFLEIPGKNNVLKTDVAGEDNMCILYAYNQIDDIAKVVNNVNNSSKTELFDKLKDVLGDRLMSEKSINYRSDKMQVSGISTAGDIIPIILEMNVK